MLNLMLEICSQEFYFEEFEEVRDFFKNVINLVSQMNFSEFNSSDFTEYEEQTRKIIMKKKENYESQGVS